MYPARTLVAASLVERTRNLRMGCGLSKAHIHPEVLVSHGNARLTVHGRLLIVQRHRAGWPKAHIAAAMGVSRKCVRIWIERLGRFARCARAAPRSSWSLSSVRLRPLSGGRVRTAGSPLDSPRERQKEGR